MVKVKEVKRKRINGPPNVIATHLSCFFYKRKKKGSTPPVIKSVLLLTPFFPAGNKSGLFFGLIFPALLKPFFSGLTGPA